MSESQNLSSGSDSDEIELQIKENFQKDEIESNDDVQIELNETTDQGKYEKKFYFSFPKKNLRTPNDYYFLILIVIYFLVYYQIMRLKMSHE